MPSTNESSPGIILRDELSEFFGQQFGGDRDTYEVLGYPDEISSEQYRSRYRRDDVAKRIVELPAKDTWKRPPDIVDNDEENETEFQQSVEQLNNQVRLYHYCKRADINAGIGEYGLLFIGFADGQPLEEPVNEGAISGPEDIAYMSPFSQDVVDSWTLGRETEEYEPTDKMYNRPVRYVIDFADVDGDPDDEDLREVHHSRVIHIAEDLVESELKGTPRQRAVWNRLVDREKVVGASAEMFWTGADRKFHFNIDSENAADIPEDQLDDLDDEVQKLVHDMQHYIKTFNTDLDVLSGEEVDPSGIHDVLLKSIASATGIPKRMLEGSERGELASSQDQANWFGQIETRRNTFAEPAILRPLIDRLIEFGVLPEPQEGTYEVQWPNLFELTELEKAEVMLKRAQAVMQTSPQGNTDLIASMEQLMDFVVNGNEIDFEDQAEDFDIDREQANNQFEAFIEQGKEMQ